MSKNTRTGGRDATTAVVRGAFGISIGNPGTDPPRGFGWRALADLARLESGHTPSRRVPEYWDGPIPWIGVRDATGNHGRTIFDTLQHVSQSGIDNSSARILPAGTVCLSRTASVGYVVKMGVPMATSQDFVNWICGPYLDADFLRYLLIAEQASVRRFAYGSVHSTLYYPDAKALHVCVPSLDEQRRIAGALGAFDDLIETERLLAASLMELQRADFLSQSRGQQVKLGEVAEVTMGQSPPGSTYNEDGTGTTFYQGVRDFGWRFPTPRVWTTAPTRLAQEGDVLVAVRAPVGEANVATETTALGRGVAGVRAPGRQGTLLQALTADASIWDIHQGTGTVFASINKSGMNDLRIPWTADDKLEARLVAVDATIRGLADEIDALTRSRDELLPLLMSGRVRVEDVEGMA